MKRNILYNVKSVITILLTLSFCILSILDKDTYSETFKTVITTVITFYFAFQYKKNGDDKQ